MGFRVTSFLVVGCLLLSASAPLNAAAIDNTVAEPRIHSSDELISNIVDDCFNSNAMHCLKEKVLTYLDTMTGVEEDVSGRAFDDDVIDKVIVDRVARILNTNEVRVQLPDTVFANSVLSYRADRGFDLEVPQNEGKPTFICIFFLIFKILIVSFQPVMIKRKIVYSCPCCCS